MTVSTKYDIGDKVVVGNKECEVKGVHIYMSDNKQTERYYLGEHKWLTIHIKGSGKE